MAFDSSTLCARTAAGEAELATPSQGLALGQRRVLTLLQDPIAVDELAEKHRLDPDKLARDLTRLADLKLVVLQGPSMATVPQAPASASLTTASDAATMAPVVIGHTTRRSTTMPLAAGIAALMLAAGIWFGTRGSPAPAGTPTPPAPTNMPLSVAPTPAPPVGRPVNNVGADVPSVAPAPDPVPVLRSPAVARLPSRSEAVAAAPVAARIAPAPALPVPTPAARPEPTSIVPTSAPPTTALVATVPAAPAVASAPPPTPAADAPPPPVQVAVAAPTLVAPRPVASTGMKTISREPPDFPKEAVADGLKSGLVNARLHVDARGNVTGVDILGSQPSKVFDRATRRALLRWQFEPNAAGQATDLDVDVKFQRD